jgi:exopolysaccharide biosynthesis polyprenyl glycosylphosphotransferase
VKKSELIFNIVSVPLDFLVILGAGSVAYFLRYRVETIPVLFDLPYQGFLQLIFFPAVFLLLLFALSGLYTQRSTRSFWRELGRITLAVSAGLMIVVVLFFFDQELFPSRLIILMAWILSIFIVAVERGVLLMFQRMLLAHGTGLHRLVVIQGQNTSDLVEDIKQDSRLGYEIVKTVRFSDQSLQEIENMHRRKRIDELLQTDPTLGNEQVLRLVNLCEELGIKFNYLPNILETHRANVETDVIGSVPVIRLKSTSLEGWGKVVKRMLDISIAVIGLALFAPLFAAIALAIKFTSHGPVFFHQRRGSSYHNFEFYKFRTMYHELSEGTETGDQMRAELERQNARHGPYVKIKNDPRVTKVGRVLRKTKFDELPQFWHVLLGQMSLVGPRIHMVREVANFESRYKKIFVIKPGATGLAQINQFYNPELPFEDEVKYDLFYIENWSLRLDIYIIFKTIVLLLTKRPKEDY